MQGLDGSRAAALSTHYERSTSRDQSATGELEGSYALVQSTREEAHVAS